MAFLGLLVVLALLLGIYLGGHSSGLPSPLSDLAGGSDAHLVQEALSVIQGDYYRKIDRRKLVNRGLEGVVRSLNDQFSDYFDPASYRAFENQTEGFSGVGLDVQADRRGLRVLDAFPGSPAARARIRSGDVIVAVNGRSLSRRPARFSTDLIKGKAGTSVALTLMRGRARMVKRLVRANVSIPVVAARVLAFRGQKLGYVRLASFTSGSGERVRRAVGRVRRAGARGIILDLRRDGGGLLDEAVSVSSIFIPDGTVVSTAGRSRPRHVYRATGGAIPTRVPVVVLVDRASASASEIVTGALQDRRRAKVVGTRTFGKGVFQEIKSLSNGGALKITVGEYFTPSGRNLGAGGVKKGRGLAPDVRASDSPRTKRDEALAVAERTLAGALR